MSRALFILGSGGQARDIAEIARALDYQPVLVARDEAERDAWRGEEAIVLESEALDARAPEGDERAFAIGIGDNRARAALAGKLGEDRHFPTLVHPDTSIGLSTRAVLENSRGTIVFPGVRIMGRCTIGDFCTLNCNATVSHDCRIGSFANLSPGAHLAGNVGVGEGAWIGMGVVVNQGSDAAPRRIGAWSVIGSGAAVIRDVPSEATQVGVPARSIAP